MLENRSTKNKKKTPEAIASTQKYRKVTKNRRRPMLAHRSAQNEKKNAGGQC